MWWRSGHNLRIYTTAPETDKLWVSLNLRPKPNQKKCKYYYRNAWSLCKNTYQQSYRSRSCRKNNKLCFYVNTFSLIWTKRMQSTELIRKLPTWRRSTWRVRSRECLSNIMYSLVIIQESKEDKSNVTAACLKKINFLGGFYFYWGNPFDEWIYRIYFSVVEI